MAQHRLYSITDVEEYSVGFQGVFGLLLYSRNSKEDIIPYLIKVVVERVVQGSQNPPTPGFPHLKHTSRTAE